MNDFPSGPPRWRDRNDQESLAERSAGHAIRAIPPVVLTRPQLDRIGLRLRAQRARPPRLWLVLAASLLLGIASAASAAWLNVLPSWLGGTTEHLPSSSKLPSSSRLPSRAPSPRPAPPGPASVPARVQGPKPPAAAQLPVNPPVGHSEIKAPARVRSARAMIDVGRDQSDLRGGWPPSVRPEPRDGALLGPAATQSPAPRSSGVAEPIVVRPSQAWISAPHPTGASRPTDPGTAEASRARTSIGPADAPDPAKLLGEAMRLLRRERSAEGALAILDRNAGELDAAGFAHEANLIRVEALLAAHRQHDALDLLDGMALSDVAASRALLVARGKLRAARERCAEAVVDFGRVLAEPGLADKQALAGRAACRDRLGDLAGSRADLERYRREFPGDPGLRDLEGRLSPR